MVLIMVPFKQQAPRRVLKYGTPKLRILKNSSPLNISALLLGKAGPEPFTGG